MDGLAHPCTCEHPCTRTKALCPWTHRDQAQVLRLPGLERSRPWMGMEWVSRGLPQDGEDR